MPRKFFSAQSLHTSLCKILTTFLLSILDPFSGAGTTVLAAVQEGYEAVGIEMSDAYFRRSTERLKTALAANENAE